MFLESLFDPFSSYRKFLDRNKEKYNIDTVIRKEKGYVPRLESSVHGKGQYNEYELEFESKYRGIGDGSLTYIFIHTILKNNKLPNCIISINSFFNHLLYLDSLITIGSMVDKIPKNKIIINNLKLLTDDSNREYYTTHLSTYSKRFEDICGKGIFSYPTFALYENRISYIKSIGAFIKDEEIDKAITLMTDFAQYIDKIKELSV